MFKQKNNVVIILDDNSKIIKNNCTEEEIEKVKKAIALGDIDEIYDIMSPKRKEFEEEVKFQKQIIKFIESSKYITIKGDSCYLESVCALSLPPSFVKAFIKAEKEGDERKIQSFINFWTLCSQNPDERARNNMFWFLEKYGLSITQSGLFVGYRNVVVKKEGELFNLKDSKTISNLYINLKFEGKNAEDITLYRLTNTTDETDTFLKSYEDELPEFDYNADGRVIIETNDFDEYSVYYIEEIGNLKDCYKKLSEQNISTIFTDSYTGKFNIKIGEPVTMDRNLCDSNQEHTCSSGLHVSGKEWLQNNYFGDVGLMVLVNPADVVAVPPKDSYGKMRTCAYYPIKTVTYDDITQKIKEENIPYGFEDDFIERILYTGATNEKDDSGYKFVVNPILNTNNNIIDRLEEISKTLKNRII